MTDRIKIVPDNDVKFNDQFWSNLYNTLCSFGFSEVRAIWMRASVFLLAHGAFLAFIGKDTIIGKASINNADRVFLLVASIIGIVAAALWFVINYLGWLYQNLWYWQAARLKFDMGNVTFEFLPTEPFAASNIRRPFGTIYYTAQLFPVLFMAIYSLLIGYYDKNVWTGVLSFSEVFLISIGITELCYKRIARRRGPF